MFKYFEPNKIFLVTSKAPKYVLLLFIITLSIGLMEALIIKLFNDRQLIVKPNTVNFLMQRIERSYLGVSEIIELIDKVSLSQKKSISIKLIKALID